MPQSYQEHNGDDSTHTFTIGFGSGTTKYLKREHIKLYYGRDRVAGTQTNTLTLNTDYVYISDLVIKLIGSTLNTGVTVGDPYPLASGRKLTIERDTPQDTLLVPWADGSNLTKEALETSNLQVLFGQQEEADTGLLNSAKAVAAETASTTATNDVAVLTANYFKRDGTLPMTGNLQLGTNKITGVGDPTAAQDVVTKAFLERSGSIASAQIVDGTIVDGDVNASAAISGSKLQASSGSNAGSMSSAHYSKLEGIESNSTADQSASEIKSSYESNSDTNAYTDAEKTKLASCESNSKDDQTASEIKSLYESNSNTNAITDTEKTNIGTITNKQPLDSELTTLSGMQAATASKLASGTALTSDIADLNQIDGLTKQTTISDSDASFPTSGAVVDYVAAQISPLGGLEVVATEVAFPNTQPASGVVISISDAGGVVINGSGVSTTGRTVGGATITINGFPSSLQGETLVAGVGLMVSSTGSSQTYNYHKILGKEDDIKQLSDDINDFNARYRVGSSNPSSALDAGDLFFNTSTSKLLVYNATNTAWEEAQSIGNFYISTLSPAFNGSLQDFTITNAPTNAEQILLSINGVIQKPNAGSSTPSEGFALSGSTVKLGAAPASTDTYFAVVIGSTVNIGTPSNNTVSTAILQNGAVTTDKIANGAVTGEKIATNLDLANSQKIRLGTSNNLELYYDGTRSWVRDSGSGNLIIDTDGSEIDINSGGNAEYMARFIKDGAVELYHNDELKLSTSATGVDIQDASATSVWTKLSNSSGTAGYVYGNGATEIGFLDGQQHWTVKSIKDGGVELFHDNSKKLSVESWGVGITGTVEADQYNLGDSDGTTQQIRIGDSGDLRLFHDGSNNQIMATNGPIHMYTGSAIELRKGYDGSYECMLKAVPDGSVELYNNNVKRFETLNNGAIVYGTYEVSADEANHYALKTIHDGNNGNRLGHYIQCGADDASGTNYAITIADGDGTAQGYITFSGGTVSYGAFTAHHPCIVPDSENPSDSSNAYPYGTLLETISIEYTQKNGSDTERGIRYKVQKTQSANSRKVLGAYGSSMNGGPDGQTNEHQALVLGDGHILVNNAGGNIEIGDGICSSATAGIGQKATANPSMIIGIAQESVTFTGSETKLVAVQYGLQQFIPWT